MGMISRRQTVSETCRELGISETRFARWCEQALEGMDAALADRDTRSSREDVFARRLAEAERTIRQLALENDLLARASRRLT
jgi:transposase-like protein